MEMRQETDGLLLFFRQLYGCMGIVKFNQNHEASRLSSG
jgi:hypothetical protein